MGQIEKLMLTVILGQHDKNIKFSDIRRLMKFLGFRERIRGDHYIYTKDGIADIINIQPVGSNAKAYQVKQIRHIILKYNLGGFQNV